MTSSEGARGEGFHLFPFDQGKADQIAAAEAVRLVEAFRLPGEPTWLQIFADGPDELYGFEEWTDRQGQKRRTQKYQIAKAAGGKSPPKPTATGGSFTLEEIAAGQYIRENLARVGVFWTVNVLKATATRRTADAVARVAAVFVDLDGAPLPAEGFHLRPTAVVESSPGRFHAYWAVHDLPLEDFTATQKHLAALYGGDVAVNDLPRVMRLPGYWHGKREPGSLTRILELNPDAQYGRAELLAAFPGLTDALAAGEVERRRQVQDAQLRCAEADQMRAELEQGGKATDQTQAQAQRSWAQVALLGSLADLLGAPEGTRNSTLNAVAYRLGRIVAAGLLDDAEVRGMLGEVAERIGLGQQETAQTISSGLESGKLKPVDPAHIGALAGAKKQKARQHSGLVNAAGRVEIDAATLPPIDEIPDPEGEGGSYTDEQVKAFLGLTWPVLAADTEKAHGYRLKALAGDDLGYVAELGGYVAWDGRQWLSGGKDGAGQVEAKRRVQELGVSMRPEIERLLSLYSLLDQEAKRSRQENGHDSKEYKAAQHKADAMEKAYYAHARAAKGTESDAKQKAILNSAKPLFRMDIKLFDSKPWLVGFQNGTWDRGEFRAAWREDHLLTLAAVPYGSDIACADWLEVLDRITGGNAELARTLQEVAGYALSGASSLRLLPWLYGPAGTGKSTFAELLATVLGEMAATIDPKLFSADAARERLGAAIWGKRVALCAEAGNARLDAEALKTLSGGDRLSVRMLYAEGFTVRASHVLVMVANDPPRVEAYDSALKDRVLALPFDHPLKAGAPLLGGRRVEELRQDTSSALVRGFTAWAVEGLAKVYRAGDIYRAEVSRTATQGFWADVDPLRDFWLSQDRSELALNVPVAVFRSRYEDWAKQISARALSSQKFNKAAVSVGLEQRSSGVKRVWRLENPEMYPQAELNSFDGLTRDGGAKLTTLTENDPISVNPISSLTRRREEIGFTENAPKVVKVVSEAKVAAAVGWQGEEL